MYSVWKIHQKTQFHHPNKPVVCVIHLSSMFSHVYIYRFSLSKHPYSEEVWNYTRLHNFALTLIYPFSMFFGWRVRWSPFQTLEKSITSCWEWPHLCVCVCVCVCDPHPVCVYMLVWGFFFKIEVWLIYGVVLIYAV